MKKYSNNIDRVATHSSMNAGRAVWPGEVTALALLIAATVEVSAVTNTYDNITSNFNAYIINPVSTQQVDIWTNGSSFNIVSNILIQTGGNPQGYSALIMVGSTGVVQDVIAHNGNPRVFDVEGNGTSVVSLVRSSLTITQDIWGAPVNSYVLGVFSMTNSTLTFAGTTVGGFVINYNGGSQGNSLGTNQLIMVGSKIDMNGSTVVVGSGGSLGSATLQNSIITNATIDVGTGGAYGSMIVSNSALHSANSYSMVIGQSGPGRTGTLTLDASTFSCLSSYGYLGFAGSTGVLTLVNGSVLDQPNLQLGLGRSSYGILNISNALFHSATLEAGGWASVGATDTGGIGVINNSDGGTVRVTTVTLGSYTATRGSYNGTGSSVLDASALRVGSFANSTGMVTMADNASVFTTNAAHTGSLVVGAAGQGTFTMNGGTLTVDQLFVTNGAASVFTFNAGTLNTRSTVVSNGSLFAVGDGIDAATLKLLGGTHTFANGLTIAQNATLMGTGTVQGATTVLGTLSPGFSPGLLHITGGLALAANATNAVDINGPTVGTQYDQVDVTGAVSLAGSVLSITLGYNPSTGTVFTIINNDATDPVVGTFAGLPNGFEFSVPGMSAGHAFNIRYNGGTGNDVTLSVVPEPTCLGLLVLGGGLAGLWSRRS